jgi:PAS domain S-box-containing protein
VGSTVEVHTLGTRQRGILLAAVAGVLGAIVAANLATDPVVARVWDNTHWTLAYATAAWLAWLGARRADDPDAQSRRLLAWALTTYAGGQLLWDVQVATGWNPFPGPSDALFICLGPLSAAGLIGFLRRRANPSQRRVIALDVAALTFAVLALTLALYLPKRGNVALLPLAVLVAYPVVLCWAGCVGVISALTLALRPHRGWVLFLGALLVNSVVWLRWNALTLDGALQDGTLYNALFSLAALAQGLGALWWRAEASPSERWARACAAALRLLPLLTVCVAALTAVLAYTLPGVPAVVQWTAWFGGAVVVALASLRQSVLIGEHEDLIRTERSLRKTEAVYRVLFEHATDGIFIADQNGRYIDVNERGTELLRRTRAEVLSLGIADIVAPEDKARVPEEVGQLLTGTTVSGVWNFVRSDRTTFPGEVAAKMLPDGRLLGTVRDISERIRLEAQLRQAQKMEAIGTLAAGIAHDFNNLVAAISGNAEIAARELGPQHRATRSLLEILAASGRAAQVVRQIVAFSRPTDPATEIVDLSRLIEEVGRLLRSTLPAGVELEVQLDPDAPNVRADASQLHQVLVNLATNAWQAMDGQAGSITIALQRKQVAAANAGGLVAGEYASLVVKDTGKGMDAQTSERIFDPFFTTKPVGQGTGLGLAVVQRIIGAHGGTIGVESRPGRGTAFIIHLPEAVAGVEVATPSVEVQASSERVTGLRIFYVDDETALVSLITRHLEECGHSVRGFSSSELAMEAAEQAPRSFDVLITDYNMPKLSGLDVASRVRAIRPELPLVLTSGSIDSELRARAEQLGVRRLLHKPYTLDELDQAIAEVARASAAASSSLAE